MIDLRHVIAVGGSVVEIPIPEVEQQMHCVRPITHVPESIFGQFQAATLRTNDVKGFIQIECLDLGKSLYECIKKVVRLAAERTG